MTIDHRYVQEHHVVQTGTPLVEEQVVATATRSPLPAATVVGGIVGVASAVFGSLVLIKSDLGADWPGQIVGVMGLDAAPLLGVFALGVGILLLLGAAARSRGTVGFVGAVLGMFGIVVLFEHERMYDDLGVGPAHGWVALILGTVLVASALIAPVRRRMAVTERVVAS